jgi:hypothetical protein
MKILPVVLTLFGVFLGTAWAEDPVHFVDPALKAAVEETLWISDPTPSNMLALTNLSCSNNDITSLVGLEYAENLETLSIMESAFTDLSPLAGLTNLRHLDIQDNDITDISALSGLFNLEILNMEDTLVTDLSPLVGLTSLRFLDVRDVPLDDDSYRVDIPRITADNPGIEILHDRAQFHLILSAGPCGSIIAPGEGDFVYEGATHVSVEAKADPGFIFAGFSGGICSSLNPFSFTFDHDFEIRANFTSVLSVIHVDDDAPGDPSPGDSVVSDPQESGTCEHPFDGIQKAIEVAGAGATVFVQGGTYHETIDLLGKPIKVTGFDPNDSGAGGWPVVDGNGVGPVVRFMQGEGPDSHLAGLVITGGRNRVAAAVYCSHSSPTIANCLILGNQATDPAGGVIYCVGSGLKLLNCTIANNRAGAWNAALVLVDSPAVVVNSILWGNEPREIQVTGVEGPAVRYSDIAGGWTGPGNLNVDPLFAHPGAGAACDCTGGVGTGYEYHLQSAGGRWDLLAADWVQDDTISACIDAGDPAAAVGAEPLPNGGRTNIGAYGGTAQASKSCPRP